MASQSDGIRLKRASQSGQVTYGFENDDNTGLHSPSADRLQLIAGGQTLLDTLGTFTTVTDSGASVATALRFPTVVKFSIAVANTTPAGAFAAFLNPFGADVLILRATLRVTTPGGVSAALDIGVAANGTTSNDTLFDGLVVTSAGIFHSENDTDNGTNGTGKPLLLTSTQYVTVAESAGDTTALVADLYLECIPV